MLEKMMIIRQILKGLALMVSGLIVGYVFGIQGGLTFIILLSFILNIASDIKNANVNLFVYQIGSMAFFIQMFIMTNSNVYIWLGASLFVLGLIDFIKPIYFVNVGLYDILFYIIFLSLILHLNITYPFNKIGMILGIGMIVGIIFLSVHFFKYRRDLIRGMAYGIEKIAIKDIEKLFEYSDSLIFKAKENNYEPSLDVLNKLKEKTGIKQDSLHHMPAFPILGGLFLSLYSFLIFII